MSAGIQEHPGNEAGRVTILTTLNSMLPVLFVVLVAVVAFLLGIISAEIAAAVLLTAIGQGTLTSGTVFTTAKKTKTDRADVVWGNPPVSDVVHPVGPVVVESDEVVLYGDVVEEQDEAVRNDLDPQKEENDDLLAQVAAVRKQD